MAQEVAFRIYGTSPLGELRPTKYEIQHPHAFENNIYVPASESIEESAKNLLTQAIEKWGSGLFRDNKVSLKTIRTQASLEGSVRIDSEKYRLLGKNLFAVDINFINSAVKTIESLVNSK